MMLKTRLYSASILKTQIAESRDRLYRVALAWCGDEMLADDLAQQTITSGIINYKQLRDKSRLYPWLYTILRNEWYRHLQSARPHEGLDSQLISEEAGPYSDYQELEMVERVRHAVASLPEKERQVISLVDLEELSYCDVASILDIPIGTVMSRLHRARKILLMKLAHSTAVSPMSKQHMRVVE
ncbi:MAG: RNA polymerase sigma factor [Halobacteria archaeon]|nr:RNA polymerase sigma factor [Halobacteria archaeon]